jgi:hypothetical protein
MAIEQREALGQLASSATAILTVPDGQKYILNGGRLTNASGSSVADIEFYIYPSGGSAGNDTVCLEFESILDKKFEFLNLRDHLVAGDVLAAKAGTASALNYFIPYTVITG